MHCRQIFYQIFYQVNTGVSSLSLFQQIFPTQELNWGLLHCRQILYQLSYQGSLGGLYLYLNIYLQFAY